MVKDKLEIAKEFLLDASDSLKDSLDIDQLIDDLDELLLRYSDLPEKKVYMEEQHDTP